MHCVKVYAYHYAAVYILHYGLCMTKKWHEWLAIIWCSKVRMDVSLSLLTAITTNSSLNATGQ
jgi:hypothetical protein